MVPVTAVTCAHLQERLPPPFSGSVFNRRRGQDPGGGRFWGAWKPHNSLSLQILLSPTLAPSPVGLCPLPDILLNFASLSNGSFLACRIVSPRREEEIPREPGGHSSNHTSPLSANIDFVLRFRKRNSPVQSPLCSPRRQGLRLLLCLFPGNGTSWAFVSEPAGPLIGSPLRAGRNKHIPLHRILASHTSRPLCDPQVPARAPW